MANKSPSTQKKSTVTTAGGDVSKADTKALITNGADAFPEDSFQGSYWTGGNSNGTSILEPQYKPGTLWALCSQNNILAQCVEAMEVNIDGTGHSIDSIHENSGVDAEEKSMLQDFFDHPYPGKTMVAIRRIIRRDIEATGNGYMEIIRNAGDEVLLVNDLDAQYIRLVILGDPVTTTKEVVRRGKPVSVKLRTRERRYVQGINGKKVYFKEFGAKRDLDRDTGGWVNEGERLPVDKRASEILHFIGNKEPKTAYGAPRWLNQLPSALGSRKAEEHNLEFFDSGGLPPVLIIVQGGTMGDEVKEDLKAHLNGKGPKHRAAIIEAISTSGTLDSAGSVQVRVERFGAERQQDAMFQAYDKNCEEHIRVSFRLPPLFIGKAADYSFASAYTSYMVAEAQVFWPEREEFDARINNTICKALGATKYKFRSLPLTLVDVANQLKAMELVSGKFVSGEEVVTKLNEITGLSMEYEKQDAPPPPGGSAGGGANKNPAPEAAPAKPANPVIGDGITTQGTPSGAAPVAKTDQLHMITLANKFVNVMGLDGECQYSVNEQDIIRKEVSSLDPEESLVFNQLVASKTLLGVDLDQQGLGALCGCATHMAE